ncbi:hypothetical protein C8Q78DRAFT_758351 [Trametes maxima]|nr:hypothetical protein C8Q78DRAFT_758351 [Trametes maxima]
MYRYYTTYPSDAKGLKALVAFVGIMETVTSVFTIHTCYHYLITHYSDVDALGRTVWSLAMYPISTVAVIGAVQGFFARRIWILDVHYRPLVVIVCVLCVVESAFYTGAKSYPATTAEIFKLGTFIAFKDVTWLLSAGGTVAVIIDVFLTAILTRLLHRSRTGLISTDSVVAMVLGYTHPEALYHVIFGIPGSKMYANSLLAALNSRQHIASYYMSKASRNVSDFQIDLRTLPSQAEGSTRPSNGQTGRDLSRATTGVSSSRTLSSPKAQSSQDYGRKPPHISEFRDPLSNEIV